MHIEVFYTVINKDNVIVSHLCGLFVVKLCYIKLCIACNIVSLITLALLVLHMVILFFFFFAGLACVLLFWC